MVIIPYQEIREITKDCYLDDGDEIWVKHDVCDGEKAFSLVLIEKCLGLLQRSEINDNFIIQYLQGLVSLGTENNHHYKDYLDVFVDKKELRSLALERKKLSTREMLVLKELMTSNLAEYTMKGEYQSCCYSAMRAFFLTAYCILSKNIDFNIGHIDVIADLYDELESIKIYESESDNDLIIVDWHSTNKINSIYMLYKTQYAGLDNECILDLVAADVIEGDYYFKDERFSIAPSILVKQYCAIIEHEVNEIIQLLNLPNRPTKHLMWYDMKKYVKDNSIDLSATSYDLEDVLRDLHGLRNKAAHGEIITKEEYKIICKYKNLGLFEGLSTEKLKLTHGKVSPTIDEIRDYMGL